jgi:Asp-tRNA(Asn)/Glu-tRNA(Gln) amidotransferase A subunit family amidase
VLDEITRLDATAQAELIRRGECTPGELVEAAIARIERLNPSINAAITPLHEQARARAAATHPTMKSVRPICSRNRRIVISPSHVSYLPCT